MNYPFLRFDKEVATPFGFIPKAFFVARTLPNFGCEIPLLVDVYSDMIMQDLDKIMLLLDSKYRQSALILLT